MSPMSHDAAAAARRSGRSANQKTTVSEILEAAATAASSGIAVLAQADVLSLLDAARRIVITTHVNPDGDALGSEIGLMHLLSAMGKSVAVRNTSGVPPNLRFMDPDGVAAVFDPARDAPLFEAADLVIVVDVNVASRLRTMEAVVRACGTRTIVIDHHLEPEPFAAGYWTDEDAAATGQMIARLVESAGVVLSIPMATALYVAIMTDTGSFRFERTSPEVHRIAARLLEAGANPSRIHQLIFDSFPFRRTLLVGRILGGIELFCDGRVTLLAASRALYAETGTAHQDLEDTVNLGLSIEGVLATALLSETDAGIRVSFRSREPVHITAVARMFGGGGHAFAAGATITDRTLDDARAAVANALCAVVRTALL